MPVKQLGVTTASTMPDDRDRMWPVTFPLPLVDTRVRQGLFFSREFPMRSFLVVALVLVPFPALSADPPTAPRAPTVTVSSTGAPQSWSLPPGTVIVVVTPGGQGPGPAAPPAQAPREWVDSPAGDVQLVCFGSGGRTRHPGRFGSQNFTSFAVDLQFGSSPWSSPYGWQSSPWSSPYGWQSSPWSSGPGWQSSPWSSGPGWQSSPWQTSPWSSGPGWQTSPYANGWSGGRGGVF
jgi:hypothetical protein